MKLIAILVMSCQFSTLFASEWSSATHEPVSVRELWLRLYDLSSRGEADEFRSALEAGARDFYDGRSRDFVSFLGTSDREGRTLLHSAGRRDDDSIFMMICESLQSHTLDSIVQRENATLENFSEALLYTDSAVRELVNRRDYMGRTAVFYASRFQNVRALETLRSLGADFSIRDRLRSMVLHHAAFHGRLPAVDFFLEHGGLQRTHLRGYRGMSPLHYAVSSDYTNREAVAQSIVDNLGGLYQTNDRGETPLHVAAGRSAEDCVNMLLNRVDISLEGVYSTAFLQGLVERFGFQVGGGAVIMELAARLLSSPADEKNEKLAGKKPDDDQDDFAGKKGKRPRKRRRRAGRPGQLKNIACWKTSSA